MKGAELMLKNERAFDGNASGWYYEARRRDDDAFRMMGMKTQTLGWFAEYLSKLDFSAVQNIFEKLIDLWY